MTTLGLLEKSTRAREPQPLSSAREVAFGPPVERSPSVYDDQVQALVQQLFFRQDSGRVRHVAFAALESQTETAQLCMDVAMAVAAAGLHDVGLIDARLQSTPLQEKLQIAPSTRPDVSSLIAPRLWLAPRRKWLDESAQRIWDPSLARLHATTMEFDFSILCFDPFSWLTSKLSQACNGVVIVLTANKTRRLVAAQMQEQLRRMRVPLLGTVLAERRFPVPAGLYRNL